MTTQWTVEWVPTSSLFANPSNPRRNDEAVPHVAASIKRFGWQQPIVAKRSGEVIAGHTRLKAAQQLGQDTVPVVRFEGTDLDAIAFGIADNRTHEFSQWDDDALAKLLGQLRDEDALDGVGFSVGEVDDLIADLDARLHKLDSVDDQGPDTPPERPTSRVGDMWLLGEHRLLCGDSTKPEDIARVLGGEQAALLSTDPPYCVNYTGNDRPIHDGKPSGKDWSHSYREIDIKDLGEFLDGVLSACLPHLRAHAPVYMWHAHVQQPTVAAAFERHGLLLHQVVVWVKPTAVFGHSYFRWRHEPCAFGWVKGNKPEHGTAQLDSVWECDWEGKQRVVGNEHPCLHPDALVLTEAGYRPIRSIRVGDRVYAADGTFRAVLDVSSHAYASPDLYRITAKGGNVSTLASDNHPFLIWRPRHRGKRVVGGDVRWLRADELRVGDYTMTPVMADGGPDPLPERDEKYWRNAQIRSAQHEGRIYSLRYVKRIERVPYTGDVWNLSVDGCPSFQTSVGMSHNTQKPTRLFEIPMELHTRPKDVVLEPFSGSGSQLIAAEKLSRRCRAVEISPAFVDVAVRRWQRATGLQAVLEATGESYDELTQKRRAP